MTEIDGGRTAAGAGHAAGPDANLRFLTRVALRVDTACSSGPTPEGICFQLTLQGTARGPELRAELPPAGAYLRVDNDGVGTIEVRAALLFPSGGRAEIEGTGRCDFGRNGFARAAVDDLPVADLGWCPRIISGHASYLWLNRLLCLGLGQLRYREKRLEYDLFALEPPSRS